MDSSLDGEHVRGGVRFARFQTERVFFFGKCMQWGKHMLKREAKSQNNHFVLTRGTPTPLDRKHPFFLCEHSRAKAPATGSSTENSCFWWVFGQCRNSCRLVSMIGAKQGVQLEFPNAALPSFPQPRLEDLAVGQILVLVDPWHGQIWTGLGGRTRHGELWISQLLFLVIWLWVKNMFPNWNPGRWKLGLQPAGPFF